MYRHGICHIRHRKWSEKNVSRLSCELCGKFFLVICFYYYQTLGSCDFFIWSLGLVWNLGMDEPIKNSHKKITRLFFFYFDIFFIISIIQTVKNSMFRFWRQCRESLSTIIRSIWWICPLIFTDPTTFISLVISPVVTVFELRWHSC